MTQIGGQRDEVPGDLTALASALLQHARGEGVPQIVDARLLRPFGRNASSAQQAPERVIDRARAKRPILDRGEQIIAVAGDATP